MTNQWIPKQPPRLFDQQAEHNSLRVAINRALRLASRHPYAFSLPAERLFPILEAIRAGSWEGVPSLAQILGGRYTREFQFEWAQAKTQELIAQAEHERQNDPGRHATRERQAHERLAAAIEQATTEMADVKR